MPDAWRPFDRNPHTVVGDLRVHDPIPGPNGLRPRPIYVWLPPCHDASSDQGTDADTHDSSEANTDPATGDDPSASGYPVVYLHDGAALFDIHLKAEADDPSMGITPGEWQVDETMTALHEEGLDAIVVGIPHAGEHRSTEYTPYCEPHPAISAVLPELPWPSGEAAAYVDWVCDVVRPLVEASFRVRRGPRHTTVGGSSLGGLVSLIALRQRPDVFGSAAVFSPAFWFTGERLLAELEREPLPPARVYLDVGGQESTDVPGLTQAYLRDAERAAAALAAQPQLDVRFVVDPAARHHETAWAARFPDAMRFLLKP